MNQKHLLKFITLLSGVLGIFSMSSLVVNIEAALASSPPQNGDVIKVGEYQSPTGQMNSDAVIPKTDTQNPVISNHQDKLIAYKKGARRAKRSSHGMASYYGSRHAMTAAHRSLPFGTRVRVTNANNGRSVVVQINDRGPFIRGRIIDVSVAAASQLGMMQSGVAPVVLEILGR